VIYFVLLPLLLIGAVSFVLTALHAGPGKAFDIATGYVSPLKDHAGFAGILLAVIALLIIPAVIGTVVSVLLDPRKSQAEVQRELLDDIAEPADAQRWLSVSDAGGWRDLIIAQSPTGAPEAVGRPPPGVVNEVPTKRLGSLPGTYTPSSWTTIPSLSDLAASGTSQEKLIVQRLVAKYLAKGADQSRAWRDAEKRWTRLVGSSLATHGGDLRRAMLDAENWLWLIFRVDEVVEHRSAGRTE